MSWVNRRTLKWLALATMFIDHIGGTMSKFHPEMYDSLLMLRFVGRLAFPLFAFQMAMTFRKTANLPKLVTNLFILALLSEIPYDLRSSGNWFNIGGQNVVWNFFFVGLVLLFGQVLLKKCSSAKAMFYQMILALLLGLLAQYGGVDYGLRGFVVIFLMSLLTERLPQAFLPFVFFEDWWVKFSLFGLPFIIYAYDDRHIRYGKWEGMFYHYFYPLHLLVLYLVFYII